MTAAWSGRRAQQAVTWCKLNLGYICWLCGHEIPDWDYSVDHVVPRSVAPELTWDASNWRPAHGRKHPDLGCPGNYGRSARKRTRHPRSGVRRGAPRFVPGW